MIRSRRRALVAGGLALGALGACATLRYASAPASPLSPIPLPAGATLESCGGLLLNRHAIGFGGLSGLHVGDDLALTAVSDLGHWLRAQLVLDAAGRPLGLDAVETGRLRQDFPIPLPRAISLDAESLARDRDGSWLVGFERWHRICRYPSLEESCERVPQAPPGLSGAPVNAGLESLAVLADGRWLAIAEGLEAGSRPLLRAWVGQPGEWLPLRYRPSPGFVPTDACPLPGGGALVVERRFSLWDRGFSGRLLRIPAEQLASPEAEATLEPELLLADLPRENWEGVSCFRRGERSMVAMLADDNEMFFQQGMLLLFAFR